MTRVCSIFSQILQLIPRLELNQPCASTTRSVMLKVSPAGDSSSPCSSVSWGTPSRCAKFVEDWLPAKGNFVIWGCPRHLLAPPWPTPMSIGLGSPQPTVFEQLWPRRSARCWWPANQKPEKKRKFRFKNPLLSLDATVIDLCATMFDWAKFRLTKGAVKLQFPASPRWLSAVLRGDHGGQKA